MTKNPSPDVLKKIDYLPGAVRATIGVYNTKEEMEIFVNTIETICKENVIKA
ncbi:MAG: hypothetical protein VXX61_02020 [Asgard group archaeon]|nr:hypothetical protein [Asgard group archaeon]